MAKILFVGDTPTVSTGFAQCTRHACAHLASLGHEVLIVGINYDGTPHSYPYKIWPSHSGDPLCGNRVYEVIEAEHPELVIFLNDPWNIQGYLSLIDQHFSHPQRERPPFKTLGWLAVDAGNQRPGRLLDLDRVAVWSQFGRDQMLAVGVEESRLDVVPLGVDLDLFDESLTRAEAKQKLPPAFRDKIIVGYVGRNQDRKRLDLLLQYFAQWAATSSYGDQAMLFLHCMPTGDFGFDIPALVDGFGLKDKVLMTDSPAPRVGMEVEELVQTYRLMDVWATTSQAEGWCLPALEAMACGVPVVVPKHSGFDWVWGAQRTSRGGEALWGEAVECRPEVVASAPHSGMWTLGRVPDMASFIAALERVVSWVVESRSHYEPRQVAELYGWERSCELLAESVKRCLDGE